MPVRSTSRGRLLRGSEWVIGIAFLFFAGTAWADDTEQPTAPPPAVYHEHLAKLLTPAEDVLKKESEYKQLQGDGIVLLDETVSYVGDDGKRYIVYHDLDKALNDSGVKSMAQDSFTYKKKFQRVYLVLAQTIQPDGTRVPVKHDAVFIKTPQDEADDSVYDDEMEMVTVYSNVKPGSITENITVLEDTSPRIPNEFSQTYAWLGAWPEYLQRFVVDLPKIFADRLKITNLGQDVPSPTSADSGPGREQYTWLKMSTPGEPEEDSKAPSDQIGPLVWLSTLPSWDAYAAWYTAPLKDTANLTPELKAQIDAWTKDAKSPMEILNILYGHVARDVRYTGFELGKSDLQPHDCMSVWQQQYGDCKDKANLLRVMLAYKGVNSWLTLLTTEHAGLANKANPDYRQFNHCIVYAQIGDKTLFCDPTLTYGVPGLLAGSEVDRDVLVLKDGKADWEHTPPFQGSALDYSFDLKLRPDGALAGWMDMTATGYYSASYQDKYRGMTKEQLLSSLQDDARTFFPNCTLADITPMKDAPAPGTGSGDTPPPLNMRAYLVLTGVLSQSDGTSELKFPSPNYFLPDISDYKTRQHPSYAWTDFSRMTAKIQLPPGWTATSLPSPFAYDSPASNFQASWSSDKDTLTATCLATIKQSLYSPTDWQTLGDAVTNLQSWTSKTLILSKSANGQIASAAPETDANLVANLPVMPTGEGQLNLIDSEFPSDGNAVARRLALQKIATLYPSDQESIVEAAIKIGSLDLDAQKWDDAINHVRPVEDANRAVLDASTIAWADFIIAEALAGEKKDDEALALYKGMVDNPGVNAFRRGWATYEAAVIMAKKSPTDALDYAEKGLDIDSDSSPSLYGFYASTAISNNLSDRLKARLTKLINDKPQDLDDVLVEVVNSAQTLLQNGHQKEGLALLAMLDSLSNPAVTGDSFAQALKKAHDGADVLTVGAKMQQDVKQLLTQYPGIAALEKNQPQFASVDDAEKTMSQHVNNSESDPALGCALRLVIGYPVGSKFTEYYWNCANYAEWETRASPSDTNDDFFLKLAALSDELPHSCDAYADTKLIQAKVLARKGKRADGGAINEGLMNEANLSDGYQGAIALQGGKNCEDMGDYAKALTFYQFAEKNADHQEKGREAMVRAALIQFDNGNKDEAFRILGRLAQIVQKGTVKPSEQEAAVIALANASTAAPAYWDTWQAWWPQWQQLEVEAGLTPVKDAKVIPDIPSMSDFEQALSTAKDNKDDKDYFGHMRTLAYAARFYPDAAIELVSQFNTAEDVLPDHANELRLLGIAILEPLTVTDPDQQRRRVLGLLINYVDTNQNAKAMDLMDHGWDTQLADTSSTTVAIHRVWGLAAINQHQEVDKVAAALENDLKVSPNSSRALTVGMLADTYVALGRQQDALKLIQAELGNPIIIADAPGQKELKERLGKLLNATGQTKMLADGVTAWLKDNQPAWWNYAEPKDANDARFAQFDQILKNPDGVFQPAELVKAGLLAPTVSTLNQDTQQEAVKKAFTTLLYNCRTQDEANALANSILNNSSFPVSLKADFLNVFLFDAYNHRQSAAFNSFSKLPASQAMSDIEKDAVKRLGDCLKVDATSSPSLVAYVQTLSQHPLDSLDLDLIRDSAFRLLTSGDIDSAEAIYHAAANYNLGPNADRTKPEFQLELLKDINFTKRMKPAIDAMRKVALNAYKPDTIAKPAAFDQRRDMTNFDDLSDADATAVRLYQIKSHRDPIKLFFWYDFMRDLRHDPAGSGVILSLLQAGLANSDDDEVKATLVQYGQWILDIDNPAQRDPYLALLQPYRDPVKYPLTMENIRLLDVYLALRQGKTINTDTDLTGYSNPGNAAEAVRLQVNLCLEARDLPKLKTTLNKLSADQLVSPKLIRITLPALEMAGMSDEASLTRDTLNRQLYQDILQAWYRPGGYYIVDVARDIEALGTARDVPPDFSAFADSHIVRQRQLLDYKLTKAYLDKDWSAAEIAGASFTQQFPTYYSMYWFFGRSLAELGKKDDAVKALTTYCQYSKDELWYPEAKALLAKLSGTNTTSN